MKRSIFTVISAIILASVGFAAEPESPEQALEKELGRLDALKMELEALQNAPLPLPSAVGEKTEEKIPGPDIEALPEAPLPGTEAEYADTLYNLESYAKAKIVYQKLADMEKPDSKNFSWIYFQLGNCSRMTGDFLSAISAYEKIMNTTPDNAWTHEAAWWAGHLKWRLVWNETMKNAGATARPPVQ